MNDFNLKFYIRLLLKNWYWIVLAVGITLISSVAIKFFVVDAPIAKYSSETIINASQVIFTDKTTPIIILDDADKKDIIQKAADKMAIDSDLFEVEFDEAIAGNIGIKVITKRKDMIEQFINKIVEETQAKIITKNTENSSDTFNELDKYYKAKISNPDGSIITEALQQYIDDVAKTNELKLPELLAAEKVVTDLTAQINSTKDLQTKNNQEITNITQRLEQNDTYTEANDKNITDTNILLKSLQTRLKESTGESAAFITKQIVYISQNLDLYNYYKASYLNTKTQAQNDLDIKKALDTNITKQIELQTKELNLNTEELNTNLAYHNAQIEILKKINAVILDNQALNSKITTASATAPKLLNPDVRVREVIVSVWLAFVLSCCGVFLKEYFTKENV